MATLNDNTMVRHPDTDAAVFLYRGDGLPEWAEGLVGDHLLGDPTSGPPPQAGKGSGRDAWLAYAEASGVAVDSDATRDDVIAACRAAGVRTE